MPSRANLSTLNIFSDEGTRTIVLMKGSTGSHLQEAAAAAFGKQANEIIGVKDALGTIYSFDAIAKTPLHFSQGRFELALRQSKKASGGGRDKNSSSASSLAPGSLAHINPNTLVSSFHESAASDGTLSRNAFVQVFSRIAPSISRKDVSALFSAFDADGNGVVDASEFVAGAVVLCGGDRDSKLRLSFDLLDSNGNGVLDQTEIEQYMTSVFRVVAHAQPEVFEQHGVSPEELAKITAQSAMQHADSDNDGVVSFEEFRAWMLSSGGGGSLPTSQIKKKSSSHSSILGSLEQIRNITGVGELSAEDVIDAMMREANERGVVDRKGFSQALASIARATKRDPRSISQAFSDALFQSIDTDGSGGCDIEELGSAFSVLCQGSRDERCIAAFELWDADSDGYLSVEEMARLLTSVFKVLYATNPEIEEEMGVSAEELGEITAQDAVDSLDTDGDGRVSFAEFRKWYSKPAAPTAVSRSSADSQDASWVSLEETRRLTGLGRFNPAVVMEAFAVVADNEGMVGKAEFLDTLRRLAPRNLTEKDAERAKLVRNRLFDLYAEGGRVDFSVLASALAMLSGGDAEDKKRSVFELVDVDQSGTVEKEEFYRFMVSTMRVLYETQPGTRERIGVGPEELAEAVTEDAFERFDFNNDNRLTYEEFSAYWDTEGEKDMTPQVIEHEHASRYSSSETLEKTRALLGLDRYPVEDLFETVAAAADHQGWISLFQFQRVLGSLAKHNRALTRSQEQELDSWLERLYTTFDTDRNGYVDFTELGAGLSVLAGGSNDARAEAAFRLFQSNGNEGTITLRGMEEYLTAVFKTMLNVGGEEVRQKMGGATCEEIARDTAEAVFSEADLNSDGTLSYEEWKKFYSTTESGQALAKVVENAPSYVPIAEVKSRTGLDRMLPADVFEHFAHAADDKGELSKPAFVSVFERIAPHPHDARLHLCLDSLFHLLDTNGDNKVDYVELSTGLSVLTGGTKKDKLASAFALLDLDGSGTIDQEELERYVTSVYRIMYSDPQSKEKLGGRSIEELARATADEVMAQANLTIPGQLTLAEFERWIEGDEGSVLVEPARRVADDSDKWLTIPEMARLTNMRSFSTEELFERFAAAANVRGELSRRQFTDCVRRIMQQGAPLSDDDYIRAEFAVDRLFDSLDTNKDGHVDFQELASGLSILAGGSRDDKVRAAFQLYDADGNGFISKDEMISYLLSVYRVLFQTQPEIEQSLDGITAEQLATVTTEEAFKEADTNNDGQLSFEEFRAWYSSEDVADNTKPKVAPQSKPKGKLTRKQTPRYAPHGQQFIEEEEEDEAALEASGTEVLKAAELTGLSNLSPSDAFNLLIQYADPRTHKITSGAFFAAVKTIAAPTHNAQERQALASACQTIHQLFDSDHDGGVDLQELAAGLAIIAVNTQDTKPELAHHTAFTLFDMFSRDRRYIEEKDFQKMLESVFRVMLATDPSSRQIARGRSAEELAAATAKSIIEEADRNRDGHVSREEFQQFIEHSVSGKALTELMQAAEVFSAGSLGLAGLRRITGLGSMLGTDVFKVFSKITHNGQIELARPQFFDVLNSFAPKSADRNQLRIIADVLFDAIDVNQSDTVSYDEMCAGLSILCQGNKYTRAQDAFALYDIDEDGFISIDELYYYLRSVFRVLRVCEPNKYQQVDVDELAHITAEKMMREADTSGDELISLEEFLAWTDSGSSSEGNNGATRTAPTTSASKMAGIGNIQEARSALGLANVSPEELFESLATTADEHGEIKRTDFKLVLMSYARRFGNAKKAESLIDVLFKSLDLNNNGTLDFSEVASGMSILVGGDKMTKLKVASQLFDLDGDGLITRDEMLTYLTSVFSVVLATQPEARARIGNVDAQTLARATCDEAFAAADLNHDGVLDFNEFAAWVLGDTQGVITRSIVDKASNELTLQDIRKVTGLERISPEVVFNALARHASESGELNRQAFNSAFQSFMAKAVDNAQAGNSRVVVNRLFDLLDADGNERVSFAELAAGLTVLCKGTKQEKTRAAFQAFGSESLDFQEVTTLLQSVFRVLLETIPGAKDRVGVTADILAEATATQCFVEKDPRHTGFVSVDDFHDFFEQEIGEM